MSILVILLIFLLVLVFSFYGKKTLLGFWGSFFLMLFLAALLFPLMWGFSFLPGAVIILILGSLKK